MKNNQEGLRAKASVDSILEVRICQEMWERIRWVALKRECSYSWVVRYAVFRLIKRVDPKRCVSYIGNPRLEGSQGGGLNQRAWARRLGASRVGEGAKHRHRMCIYGEDEVAIRHAATYYGCTMTHLVRVALELHFERLYASLVRGSGRGLYFQRAFWFWLGVKIFKGVEFHSPKIEQKAIHFRRYRQIEYYNKTTPW